MKDSKFIHPQKCNGSVLEETNSITISIDKYLTDELVSKIAAAQWHTDKPEWINKIKERIYCDIYESDCFTVVAVARNGEVIGRIYCVQSIDEKDLWYYGDLFVIPKWRRKGIAVQMIRAAISHLSGISAKVLCCYVEPDNYASIALQKSIGFLEKPFRNFNNLLNEGRKYFEIDIPALLSAVKATAHDAVFAAWFYKQNEDALHGGNISYQEFKSAFLSDDSDEQNFLLCLGCVPVAWFKVNVLKNDETAWISMIVVSRKHQRQGAGEYAVKYCEDYLRRKGFAKVGIHTTDDNTPAKNLYIKCGYRIKGEQKIIMGDASSQIQITFEKSLQNSMSQESLPANSLK